ncbi:hypothetical protein Pfo_028661 [Paulownia fortunei]|nr:hypothetical protein Pfo_028661 [Paulownia fortunei]
MAHKQLLQELLKEDQEPFHLKSYIADRRSQLKNPSPTTTLQLKKRKPIVHETSTNRSTLCKHACFFSFQNSPDVRKSPFLDFPSPAKSPCKSPNGAVFLHIPSRTAALLVEAAMRIQKQQQSKPKAQSKNVGFGLFGSFLKRLKDRSKNKRRAIGDDLKVSGKNVTELEEKLEETIRISCSCSNRRLSSANWTENNEDKSLDFGASTSSCGSECSEEINGEFALSETRFCSSPFRFSLHKSPSSSGRRTPDFCSPAASPTRHANQEKENHESRNSDNVQERKRKRRNNVVRYQYWTLPSKTMDVKAETQKRTIMIANAAMKMYKGTCGHTFRSTVVMTCTLISVKSDLILSLQRAKQQLLYRLRRFEELAKLDPIELERKLMEGSDDEDEGEREESEGDEPLSAYRKQSVETFVSQVFNQSSLKYHSRNMSTDMKRLVSDLIVEEKSEMIHSGNNEVVMGRICNRLDSWKEVEFDTIDMMIGLDFKREFDGWTKFREEVEETQQKSSLQFMGYWWKNYQRNCFTWTDSIKN